MNRLLLLILSALVVLPSLSAQTQFVATRVFSNEPQAVFYVDETYVKGSQTFLWPEGSKHILRYAPVQASGESNTGGSAGDSRYTVQGWKDNVGEVFGGEQIIVTAKTSITFYQLQVQTEYLIKLRVAPCTFNQQGTVCVPDDPNPPGTVVMDGGTVFTVDTNLYLPAGSTHTWQAVPNPGNVFTDWVTPAGRNLAFHISLDVKYPYTLQSHWSPAKRVTYATDPPGLKVRVDGTPTNTPWTLDFGPNTTHVMGAPSPQLDKNGQNWVFAGWSNGMGQDATYTVGPFVNSTDLLTARFTPATTVTFQTDPPGLSLSINGRQNWPSYSFIGTAGTTWEVSAPLEQFDATGRKFSFAGWSNGGSATQTVTALPPDPKQGMVLTAKYLGANRLTIVTNPPGLGVQVDGADCRTPCTMDRQPGTQVSVSAPAVLPTGDDTRLEFVSWSDGASNLHEVSFASSQQTLTANYQTSYRVRTLTDPPSGGSVNTSPGSPDGFFPANTQLSFAAVASPGYRFRSWDGDVNSQGRLVSTILSGPLSLRASFDKTPFIPEHGVKNAAGDTPDFVVAPGSIMSILGASLSNSSETGPVSPMAQSLGGVVVTMQDRVLPLFSVAPEQINALVPADLPEGTYNVTVTPQGLSQVTTPVNLVRNAPGLFTRQSGDISVVNALHEDGSAIGYDSPAKRGETITIYGTGFGPYDKPVPMGFAVPSSVVYTLADSVDVLFNDQMLSPVSVVATPGVVGLTSLQLKIVDPLPTGSTVDLRIRINGRESNTVQLPLE